MNKKSLLFALLLFPLSASSASIEEMMIGTWCELEEGIDLSDCTLFETFHKDGTYSVYADPNSGMGFGFDASGKWHREGDKTCFEGVSFKPIFQDEKVDSYKRMMAQMIEEEFKKPFCDEVLSITDKEYRYRSSETGEISTMYRVDAPKR